MTLNISDMRIAISQGYDTSEEDALQLLNIVETAYKYVYAASAIKSELVTDSQAEVDRYNDACSRLEELLEDVEMGDD